MRRFGCALGPETAWRHLVCEECSPEVEGGYDVTTNQVVVCWNRCRTGDKVEEILTHELVHMYDHCTAEVNFEDVRHLACSEIRFVTTLAGLTKCCWVVIRSFLHQNLCAEKSGFSCFLFVLFSAKLHQEYVRTSNNNVLY